MQIIKISNFLNKHEYVLLGILLFLNTLLYKNSYYEFLIGENGLIEITQVIFLLMTILLNLNYRKLLISNYHKHTYFLKLSFFIFLFYEEVSFLTSNLSTIINHYNIQNELNIHNNYFIETLYFDIPLLGENIGITTIFEVLFLMIISFGNLIRSKKVKNLFFLEKKFLYLITIYMANLSISFFLIKLGFFQERIIFAEIMELIIYIVLFLDSSLKIRKCVI